MELKRNIRSDAKGLKRRDRFIKSLKEVTTRTEHRCEVCGGTIVPKEKVWKRSISHGDYFELEWIALYLCSQKCLDEYIVRLGNKDYQTLRGEEGKQSDDNKE